MSNKLSELKKKAEELGISNMVLQSIIKEKQRIINFSVRIPDNLVKSILNSAMLMQQKNKGGKVISAPPPQGGVWSGYEYI